MSSPSPPAPLAARGLLPLFTLATFAGAFLLFWIQPLFAKAVLPLLGGSPGVWNTALVFFQGTLLAGYLYVHLGTRYLGRRTQVAVHFVVLVAAFLALPLGVAEGWTPPTTSVPMPWLLALLAVSIGLPFFAVSATAPLVQRWFATTGHPDARDPYFLYSASNLGSLGALLTFPVLLEPLIGLHKQSWMWTGGYALLVLLLAACGGVAWRARRGRAVDRALGKVPLEVAATGIWGAGDQPGAGNQPGAGRAEGREAVERTALEDVRSWRRRLHWLVLAAVPSSLLLGVTSHISTDLASFPLLWVIPLVLYLLTFIVSFARRPLLRHEWMLKTQPYLLLFLALSLTWEAAQRLLLFNLLLHLAAFFVIAMVCHRELAGTRPPAHRLTEFYFWMSLGGVLGGAFTALAAPVLFDSVLEYPLFVVAAATLRPVLSGPERRFVLRDLVGPVVMAVGVFAIVALVDPAGLTARLGLGGPLFLFGAGAMFTFALASRPVRFGLGLGLLFVLGYHVFEPEPVIARERSFFGVHRVKVETPGPYHLLYHGTTLHGAQHMAPGHRRDEFMYYVPQGPPGQVFDALQLRRPARRIGVLGLGSGALSCYSRTGQRWTFFEIDPVVERIARDTTLFRYLEACGDVVDVVLGDGRLSLQEVPDDTYDLLIFDAFTSDAIPMHLITVEALELYASKLAPGGLVLFHLSNRYMNLQPVLANIVSAAGLAGRLQHFSVSQDARNEYIASSTWGLIARREADLEAVLGDDDRWHLMQPDSGIGTWTDDFSNILEVLNFWAS